MELVNFPRKQKCEASCSAKSCESVLRSLPIFEPRKQTAKATWHMYTYTVKTSIGIGKDVLYNLTCVHNLTALHSSVATRVVH